MDNPIVPVTAEDREAAAKFREFTASVGKNGRGPVAIRAGEWDDREPVQAFARHRLATSRTSAATVQPVADVELAEALDAMAERTEQLDWRYCLRGVASSIRAAAALPLLTPAPVTEEQPTSADQVVVPRVPTEAMLETLGRHRDSGCSLRNLYDELIAAAPSRTGEGE